MEKVITFPVYQSLSQAQEDIKKYDFKFAYKVDGKIYYEGEEISAPEGEKSIDVPFNEMVIQISGDEESTGLTYLDGPFITFNELT
jgi:hypothetical protein